MDAKTQLEAIMAAHRRWREAERRGIMRRLALLGYRCETWAEARATGLRLVKEGKGLTRTQKSV